MTRAANRNSGLREIVGAAGRRGAAAVLQYFFDELGVLLLCRPPSKSQTAFFPVDLPILLRSTSLHLWPCFSFCPSPTRFLQGRRNLLAKQHLPSNHPPMQSSLPTSSLHHGQGRRSRCLWWHWPGRDSCLRCTDGLLTLYSPSLFSARSLPSLTNSPSSMSSTPPVSLPISPTSPPLLYGTCSHPIDPSE